MKPGGGGGEVERGGGGGGGGWGGGSVNSWEGKIKITIAYNCFIALFNPINTSIIWEESTVFTVTFVTHTKT